ncbi:hypothetical protein LEP1GSC040_2933 [Leptospira santarosai str. 2000030832]|uniref:hypothetical protein n=1 Tax=Leptospira santarosai TaxID=28183 RepID=UPI0002BF636E|nr:hypothetical protein [Leptospira santarosai]EMM75934.1 hypothetical protein LEP1GSC040_2933 [Leptospira santarosai str. 2000030832]
MKHSQTEKFQIPEKFYNFLKLRLKDFKEQKYVHAFEKVNWPKIIKEVYGSVNQY